MKVLQSYKIYRPDVDGGIPYVMAALCKLPDLGIKNVILVARRFGMGRRYEIDQIPVEAVSSFGTLFSTPLAPTYLFKLIRRARNADIVILHAPFPLADIASIFFPDKVGLVIYWHAEIAAYPLLRKLVSPAIKLALKRADRIIVSDLTIMRGSPLLSEVSDKVRVVPYDIDVDFWTTINDLQRATINSLRERFPRMVLAIGRLVPYKGFDVLIRAAKEFDAQVVIIGEGPLEQALKQLAELEGVSDRVTFVGRIPKEDVKIYMHAARMLAFPSTTVAEAFGIVQIEAMATGLPIVNTDLPSAVPLVARHGKEALTVQPGDASAFARAVRTILDQPALAAQLSQGAQLRARAEYDYPAFINRVRSVYEEVVHSRQSRLDNK